MEAVRALEALGVEYGSYADDPLVRAAQDDAGGGGGGTGPKPKVDKRTRKDQTTHAVAIAMLNGLGFEPNRRGAFKLLVALGEWGVHDDLVTR